MNRTALKNLPRKQSLANRGIEKTQKAEKLVSSGVATGQPRVKYKINLDYEVKRRRNRSFSYLIQHRGGRDDLKLFKEIRLIYMNIKAAVDILSTKEAKSEFLKRAIEKKFILEFIKLESIERNLRGGWINTVYERGFIEYVKKLLSKISKMARGL